MYLILAKFRYDWVKIVDFLIKGHFWSSPHWADQVCNKNILEFIEFGGLMEFLIIDFESHSNINVQIPIANSKVKLTKNRGLKSLLSYYRYHKGTGT